MHQPGPNGGRFVIQRDGRDVATLAYAGKGPLVTLVHTEVDPVMRGTGAGKTLVDEAVQWARASGTRLAAQCPYAKSVLEKTAEYHDVFETSH
jgi:predicted GNAT family acetyltransferase